MLKHKDMVSFWTKPDFTREHLWSVWRNKDKDILFTYFPKQSEYPPYIRFKCDSIGVDVCEYICPEFLTDKGCMQLSKSVYVRCFWEQDNTLTLIVNGHEIDVHYRSLDENEQEC